MGAAFVQSESREEKDEALELAGAGRGSLVNHRTPPREPSAGAPTARAQRRVRGLNPAASMLQRETRSLHQMKKHIGIWNPGRSIRLLEGACKYYLRSVEDCHSRFLENGLPSTNF